MATKQQDDKAAADVSFGVDGVDTTLPVKPEQGGVPAVAGDCNLADEVDDGDIRVPFMVLAQRQSPLADIAGAGAIIYDKDTVILPPNAAEPLIIVVADIVKAYEEWLDFDDESGRMPERAYTKDEVLAKGGTLQWKGRIRPTWRAVGLAKVAVQRPVDPEGETDYVYTFKAPDGKCYAPARWKIKGKAYTPVAGQFIQAELNRDKPHGVTSDFYAISVTSDEFTKGGKKVIFFTPEAKPVGPVPAETAEFFRR